LKLLAQSFKYYPNKIAIIDIEGSITYGELERLEKEYGQHLQELNLVKKRVIVKGKNDRYIVALILALIKNDNEIILQEPQSTVSETERIVEFYGIEYLLEANKNGVIKLELSPANESLISECKIYYFSSGSVGIPKIFGFTTTKFESLFQSWINYIDLKNDDVTLCPLSLTHFHGSVISFTALMAGNSLIFLSESSLQMTELEALLINHLPSIITGVPNLYQKLITHLPIGFNGFKNIKYAFCGSAPMSAQLAQNMFDTFGIYINQAYGLSEIGPICVDLEPQKGLGTVGKVIPTIEYKVVDENDQPVAKGNEGELVVKADFMTDGYLMQEQLTKETFRKGWLYTNDIVVEDEFKRLTIVGRKSSFINIAGFKVQPIEIEDVITSFQSDIIVAVKEKTINGKQQIVAYLENGEPIDINALEKYCAEKLAHYKRPTSYVLVDQLPKNTIGKIRYNLIQE
jgi:acyl-CoA synthetase (AMP-forming)/AMP-acid ligase II